MRSELPLPTMSPTSELIQLAEEPLGALLQLFESLKQDVDVSVETPHGRGVLKLRDGRLRLAVFGKRQGAAAASALLSESVGGYRLSYDGFDDAFEFDLDEPIGRLLLALPVDKSSPEPPGARTIIERKKSELPSGLPAIQLRVLSALRKPQTIAAISAELSDLPHATFRAVRALFELGLLKECTSRTLYLGSPSTAPQRRLGLDRDQRAEPAAAASGLAQPVPARLARGAKPLSGRYSSAPPPALAEEQVQVPQSLGGQSTPKIHVEVPGAIESPRTPRTLTGATPLSSLDELDDPLHDDDASFVYDDPEEEAPQAVSFGNRNFEPRRTQETFHDAAVMEAARGQLTDSEMPVPSSHLGRATLEQLGQLNEAIASSRSPFVPESEPGSSGEMPPPASMPGSTALPSTAHFNQETGLPTVGRYEVLARLKSGGMGSVYMCRLSGAAGFRRLFAMKVLHGHLADEEDTLASFFHEARVLAGLHHPNVVGIVDVGTPQEPYIVLDYVEGGSLLELFRSRKGRNAPAQVVTVILDALAGLQAAHTSTDDAGEFLGLVHCDVTPHNLLVGVDGTCRITDFGIAQTAQDGIPEVIRGKPGYISPERLNREPADRRADIFSMGVILYRGLTGEEPFLAENSEETIANLLRRPLAPPSRRGHRPPPCFDEVCMKALALNPDERFSSAEEMAQELRRAAGAEGLVASPSEVAKWVKKSIAPTLAARRAASQRGTASTGDASASSMLSRPPSNTPDSAAGSLQNLHSAPAAEPSRMENTGPLSSGPPSATFGDRTEILDSMMPAPGIVKKVLLYVALAAGMGLLVMVVFFPDTVSEYFRPPPPRDGQAAPADSQQLAAPVPQEPANGAQDQAPPQVPDSQADETDETDEADETDETDETGIVIPEIQPNH